MLDIKDLVGQLSDKDYNALLDSLSESKAEKSYRLLQYIREGAKSDREIIEALEVNSTAFYTLRSRLNDKLQDFLLQKVQGPKVAILEKVNNLDHILFHYPQKQATSIVEKLQEEVKRFDQPIYLLKVYSSLKKLFRNTPNEYIFSQLFNQHLTYIIDYDKNEDLLAELLQTLGMHLLSREPIELEKLHIIMAQIEELNSSYQDSARFYIIRAIASIYYQVYLDEADQTVDLESVEDIFLRANQIIAEHAEDIFFGNLRLLFDYLGFEYYSKYGIRKKSQEYYQLLEPEIVRFLNSYTYYAIPSMLLLSILRKPLSESELTQLQELSDELTQRYDISKDDPVNFINFYIFQASLYFRVGKYEQSNQFLNELRNQISFKAYPHAELEVKLLMATNYMLLDEHELSVSLIKSIGRKMATLDYYDYPNVKAYRKLLQQSLKNPTSERRGRMAALINEFNLVNRGSYNLLTSIGLSDELIPRLLRMKS